MLKRIKILLSILVVFTIFSVSTVHAYSFRNNISESIFHNRVIQRFAEDDEYIEGDVDDVFGDGSGATSCEELLDANAVALVKKIFDWIRIITPIFLIVLGAVDFGKAVLANDEKQMAQATRNFVVRCIIAVAIFFVPMIVYYFLGASGIINSSGGICNFLQ